MKITERQKWIILTWFALMTGAGMMLSDQIGNVANQVLSWIVGKDFSSNHPSLYLIFDRIAVCIIGLSAIYLLAFFVTPIFFCIAPIIFLREELHSAFVAP